MILLDGKNVAANRRDALKPRIETFKKAVGRAPHLAVLLVGDDPASQVYVRNKHRACQKTGMDSSVHTLPANSTQDTLHQWIERLNLDPRVDGILVQLPLPKHLSVDPIFKSIMPEKDADGITYANAGFLMAGKAFVKPCTPSGIMSILDFYKIKVEGMNAVVVGRSQIVGKPMSVLLSDANATVTLCHSKTRDLRDYTSRADLVVVAAGQKRFLGKEDFKKGAVVIDVGMHGTGSGELCGDVRFEELADTVSAITPVPGGVGPMTITSLLENTVFLAEVRAGLVRLP
ncbi:bifunctional methylenetetrahydrofolate dehydrogenase/methenyltetrahydrofolate cyclohydrolase FolD [Bdellovibrio sp. HCB337]|uniref:bifunctional methylenetetrahydrofolate dehydrogenase/methenyltetrahydrofolate cyclohydrolase FolD n=1 Tax=Bdellovibrio sp. HCB337 TaxID=3394358 RepID=UPI0039A60EFA